MLKLFRPAPLALGAALLIASTSASGFEPFTIEDIRVEGLQRIAAGTVFNYLPLRLGDRVDEEATSRAIRALYQTGFFDDVVLERENGTLVVFVSERPAISEIDIEGNEAMETEQLMHALGQIGLAEGRVFNPSLLDRVEQELKQQYLSFGKYAVEVQTEVRPLERNRVAVSIRIDEGAVATIEHINIIGNEAFSEEELLELFQLGPKPPISFFSDRDQYSRQKLSGDLERLRSFYLNRGYIQFNIESTQVTVTPDLANVYVTINLHEGNQYAVSEVRIEGETILPSEELHDLVTVEPGAIFSRREVTESVERITDRLGDIGFAFANVNTVPDVDEEARQVALTFFVDPGRRVYVRRINVRGNVKTDDEVIRRELRQMEAAWFSTEKVRRSRTRLDRLGFFEEVNIETPTVPGHPDQVDLEVSVREREAFGSLNLGIGYGEEQGLLLSASIDQQNFMGTGKRLGLNFSNSDVNTHYAFSFTDPFYTLDGVSRTINAFYRETDAGEADVASYTTDAYGGGVSYGIPWTEWDTVRLGVAYEATRLYTTTLSPQSIRDFVDPTGVNTSRPYSAVKLTGSWTHDTLDKAIFPTRGNVQSFSAEVAVPVEDLSFYKLRYTNQLYMPVTNSLTFMVKGELAWADAYGDMHELPPFEKYYAGGTRTVRGYKANRLGPRDTNGDPLGGNVRAVGNMELIFPSPFSGQEEKTRLSLFVDAGNVFNDGIEFGELRYSTGIALQWLTPIGPLSFSVAAPLNDKDGDETESFQFTLGTFY